MEIELFWKRSSFYWVFVGAALVAYDALRKEIPHIGILVAAFGLLSSIAWLLGNVGSKWWIENWEKKLEEAALPVVGDLFEVSEESIRIVPGITLVRFSVTRLAILLSAFVTILWFGIFLIEIVRIFPSVQSALGRVYSYRLQAIPAVAILFVILFFTLARGGNRRRKQKQGEPGAGPNGGPATPHGTSGATEGPPGNWPFYLDGRHCPHRFMTAIYNISVGGADVARAFLSLTPQKEIVIYLLEGDHSVRLIGTDMRYLCGVIANHLVAKHGDKKLEVREAQPAELSEFERKFREIKDELLQFLRK